MRGRKNMKIKDAADNAGLSVKTLQHFDNINLLSPHRTANGYRDYTEDDIRLLRIKFHTENGL